MEKANKKKRGQFYTTQSSYILEGFPPPPRDVPCIVEPFAGKGDLIDWVRASGSKVPVVAYDIEPKRRDIQLRDTLADPPDYENAWIITNPPYLARNKSSDKTMYDRYDTNDLYKCFLTSLTQQGPCRGGIFILPAGFFFSPREVDVRCRDEFMTRYRITKVKYFEESVFEDTTTTIVAFSFEFSNIDLKEQTVEWVLMPSTNSWGLCPALAALCCTFCPCSSKPLRNRTSSPLRRAKRAKVSVKTFSYACPRWGFAFA
jgi:hypothetical protein